MAVEFDFPKLCKLAQIQISEEETRILEKKLNTILDFFGDLAKIPTHGIEPLYTLQTEFILREDTAIEPKQTNEILQNAPSLDDGMYSLPRVVGEAE